MPRPRVIWYHVNSKTSVLDFTFWILLSHIVEPAASGGPTTGLP